MPPEIKSHLKIVKPSTEAEKERRTTLETIFVTPNEARAWKVPSFQRELETGDKPRLPSPDWGGR